MFVATLIALFRGCCLFEVAKINHGTVVIVVCNSEEEQQNYRICGLSIFQEVIFPLYPTRHIKSIIIERAVGISVFSSRLLLIVDEKLKCEHKSRAQSFMGTNLICTFNEKHTCAAVLLNFENIN